MPAPTSNSDPGPVAATRGPLAPDSLLKAARRVMRPMVRLMMRSGVTFPVLADTLRHLFVEVAVADILTDPKARTDSRISLLTGVHRKEIKRLRDLPPDATATQQIVTIASQIIATWLGGTAFTGADGRPLALPRSASAAGPSFDTLVESVTNDIRPRAVLEDLLSHGMVYIGEQDQVHLNTDAFIPRPGGEEQLFYFARNLHDHVAAAVLNISADGAPPFLDRSVHYDGLTEPQARMLEAFARSSAMRALLAVNSRAIELLDDPGPGPSAERRRVNFGVYVFGEAEPPAAGDVP